MKIVYFVESEGPRKEIRSAVEIEKRRRAPKASDVLHKTDCTGKAELMRSDWTTL